MEIELVIDVEGDRPDEIYVNKKRVHGETVPNLLERRRVRSKWDLATFLERAEGVNGGKFDYSLVTEESLRTFSDRITVICTSCSRRLQHRIYDHTDGAAGCRHCPRKITPTLNDLIERGNRLHKGRYSYARVTEWNVGGVFYVLCKTCLHPTTTTFTEHLQRGRRCADCKGEVIWSVERFLMTVAIIHGYSYKYKLPSIITQFSRIEVECVGCSTIRTQSLHDHLAYREECSTCRVNLEAAASILLGLRRV